MNMIHTADAKPRTPAEMADLYQGIQSYPRRPYYEATKRAIAEALEEHGCSKNNRTPDEWRGGAA